MIDIDRIEQRALDYSDIDYKDGLELVRELRRMQAENAELKAHIERWSKDITFNFDPRTDHARSSQHPDYCGYCEFSWPCLWTVAKGWESEG